MKEMMENAEEKAVKAKMSRFDIWLVDLLTREDKLSFEKIAERWKKDSLNNTNEKKELALRTFHNHRKSIKEKLGVEVCCDKSTNTYYIKKVSQVSIEKSKFIAQLVSNSSVLNYAENLQDRVLLEQHAKNTFLKDIIAAMEQGVKIKLKYQKYTTRQSVSERKVAPYCVKLFRNRWYLLAAVNHLKPKLYALDDRTKEVKLTAETFEMPKDFNAQTYFKDAFGVYTGNPVERIKIKTFGNETLYWRSAPLHPSQKEIETTKDYSIFELNLFPAWEFKQELFSRIDQIEVLEPQSLREEVIGFIDRMRKIYNPKE